MAAQGLGIAFSLWWIYFDTRYGSEIEVLRSERRVGIYFSWLYIHFPLLAGFTACHCAAGIDGYSVRKLLAYNTEKDLSGFSSGAPGCWQAAILI